MKKSGENGSSGNGISSSGTTAAATTAGATTTTNATTSTIINTSGPSSNSSVPANKTLGSNGSSSTPSVTQLQNPPMKATGGAGKSTGSSTTASENGTNRGRRDRPCDACRRRKSRCVMNEGAEICVLCQFHSQECTFVQSPQPRKRRLASTSAQGSEEQVVKKRYVARYLIIFVSVGERGKSYSEYRSPPPFPESHVSFPRSVNLQSNAKLTSGTPP